MTQHLVNRRFTVTISGQALREARAAGDNLPVLIARSLARINVLLPGPRSAITVGYAQGSALITQAGVDGFDQSADRAHYGRVRADIAGHHPGSAAALRFPL